MSNKLKKLLSVILYGVALFCCMLTLVLLLLPFDADHKEQIGYNISGSYEELTADSWTTSGNFFSYIDTLNNFGASHDDESMFLCFFAVSAVVALILLIITCVASPRKKLGKIVLSILSLVIILPIVWSIIVQDSSGLWSVYNFDWFYLDEFPGTRFNTMQCSKGNYNFIPIIILLFLAFTAQCTASIINLFVKEPKITKSSEISTTSDSIQPASTDELLKLKNLLDENIISQEEFDAKKKQLLGL